MKSYETRTQTKSQRVDFLLKKANDQVFALNADGVYATLTELQEMGEMTDAQGERLAAVVQKAAEAGLIEM